MYFRHDTHKRSKTFEINEPSVIRVQCEEKSLVATVSRALQTRLKPDVRSVHVVSRRGTRKSRRGALGGLSDGMVR